MATLENVCLSCGDKLQAQGVIVLSVERYRNMEKEIQTLKLEVIDLQADIEAFEMQTF